MRQSVIANNIANSDTPGFRRSEVQFETLLAQAMESGGKVTLEDIRPLVVQPQTTPVNESGNDVSMEMELGELIKNASTYKVYLRLLSKVYHQNELAMQQP